MTPPPTYERALISVCYDGTVVTTRWDLMDRWMLAPQMAQADMHRGRVLAHDRGV